jgi:hypothetical protein
MNLITIAFEKPDFVVAFNFLNMLGNGRLSDAKFVSSFGEVETLGNRIKYF